MNKSKTLHTDLSLFLLLLQALQGFQKESEILHNGGGPKAAMGAAEGEETCQTLLVFMQANLTSYLVPVQPGQKEL